MAGNIGITEKSINIWMVVMLLLLILLFWTSFLKKIL